MSEDSKFITIYMSREMRQASEMAFPTTDLESTSLSETSKSQAIFRVAKKHSHHWSLGIRRSFASTDLLHSPHPMNAHSALSLDRLEAPQQFDPDSGIEQQRVELQPTSDTQLKHSPSGRLSMEDIALPAGGEGNQELQTEKLAGTDQNSEDEWMNDREETGEPAMEICSSESSLVSIDEEEEGEEEEGGEVKVNSKDKKKKKKKATEVECSTSSLQEFHSLPKSLVPSEIAHCLFELEEECRGVERESESVKWKMQLIHRSVQTVQETLKTLLIRLVEAQSNGSTEQTPSFFCQPPQATSPSHHRHLNHKHPPHAPSSHSQPLHVPGYTLSSVSNKILSTHSVVAGGSQVSSGCPKCFHQHCPAHLGVGRRPSETCLPQATQAGHCHQQEELPSCAQRMKEREAALTAITELKAEVARLRQAQEEERKEHQDLLVVLRGFQHQMGQMVSQWQDERENRRGGQSCVSAQLEYLQQQTTNVNELTRHAVSVFSKVRQQLEGLVAAGTLVSATPDQLDSSTTCTDGLLKMDSPVLKGTSDVEADE